MHFSRLHLENWKNFRRVDAALGRRVYLVGPNAAGKSNLLDAFRFLRDVAAQGLGRAVALRGGVGSLRCLFARQYSSILLECQVSRGGADAWRYLLELNQDQRSVPRVRREVVVDLSDGRTVLERPDESDRGDDLRLTQTALEQIIANQAFRPLSEFLKSVRYQHLVPQVVRDPRAFSAVPVHDDPFGRDFLLRVWDTQRGTRDAWLRRIAVVLKAAMPELDSLGVEYRDNAPHLVAAYKNWRPHPAGQDESQLSDGTLRLLGLLWSVFEGDGPLLLEEPELSLHVELVRRLPELFARLHEEIARMRRERSHEVRQLVISTHSSEMLSDESIGPDEVLRVVPAEEGSRVEVPDAEDRARMAAGLSVAEVVLRRARPGGRQIEFDF